MRVLKITLATLFALVICCPLFACGGGNSSGKTYELWSDYNRIETEEYSLSMSYTEDFYLNNEITFSISIKNKKEKVFVGKFGNAKLFRESNEVKYSVGSFFGEGFDKFSLECDLKERKEFSATIPTSTYEEKYYFEIMLNKDKYIFYLYEKPNELREKHTVLYNVDGEIVRSLEIPDKRLYSLDSYVDDTNLYGCGKWYYDEAFTQEVPFEDRVNKSTTLYGKKESILKYRGHSSLSIEGVNFVPSNGEIVIPKSFGGDQVGYILSGAFGSFMDELKELKIVYIPKNVRVYGAFNYCPNLKTIYYEGTEEDWKAWSYSDIPSGVEVIYNTYK